MTFNIGQQSAGVVNNVAGNQTVHGGQYGAVLVPREVTQALVDLRTAVESAMMPLRTATAAQAEFEAAERAVQQPQPDQEKAAGALERFTRFLVSAGPLAVAAAAFVGPLETLGRWLGPLGAHLLSLLTLL